MEMNRREGIRRNIFKTKTIQTIALACGVGAAEDEDADDGMRRTAATLAAQGYYIYKNDICTEWLGGRKL